MAHNNESIFMKQRWHFLPECDNWHVFVNLARPSAAGYVHGWTARKTCGLFIQNSARFIQNWGRFIQNSDAGLFALVGFLRARRRRAGARCTLHICRVDRREVINAGRLFVGSIADEHTLAHNFANFHISSLYFVFGGRLRRKGQLGILPIAVSSSLILLLFVPSLTTIFLSPTASCHTQKF